MYFQCFELVGGELLVASDATRVRGDQERASLSTLHGGGVLIAPIAPVVGRLFQVEVKVGIQGMHVDKYQTLLPLTSLQSWAEAKNGQHKSRRKMYCASKLHQHARGKKWGLIRVEVVEGARSRQVKEAGGWGRGVGRRCGARRPSKRG